MAFYATTAPGSAFLTDTRPPDLVGTVGLLNFATAGDVNRASGPEDTTAYYSLPAANATTRFEALADRALTQGGYIAWEGEAGGAASPGVRYALTGDGVSNEGSWLFDEPGALTRIAYHGSALDVLRARQPTLKIGFQFGLPSVTTVAAAAAEPVAYAALLDAEQAADLDDKVDYLIVTAFASSSDQAAWRAKVDMDAATIAARYSTKPVMLMVNHTIGALNDSNYDAGFWRYQIDTAAEKGWDVLLYNLAGPTSPAAWAVVRGYPGASEPMGLVVPTTLLDRLWTIVTTGTTTPTLVKVGNRVSKGDALPSERRTNRTDPSSFPWFQIDVGASGSHSGYGLDATLATEDEDFLADYPDANFQIERTEEVLITIFDDRPHLDRILAVNEAIIDDIMRAKPRLGIPDTVLRVGEAGRPVFTHRVTENRQGQERNGYRLPYPGHVCELRFRVVCLEDGRSSLIP